MLFVLGDPALHLLKRRIPAARDELHDIGVREPGATCFRIRLIEWAQPRALSLDPFGGVCYRGVAGRIGNQFRWACCQRKCARDSSAQKQYWQTQRNDAPTYPPDGP